MPIQGMTCEGCNETVALGAVGPPLSRIRPMRATRIAAGLALGLLLIACGGSAEGRSGGMSEEAPVATVGVMEPPERPTGGRLTRADLNLPPLVDDVLAVVHDDRRSLACAYPYTGGREWFDPFNPDGS